MESASFFKCDRVEREKEFCVSLILSNHPLSAPPVLRFLSAQRPSPSSHSLLWDSILLSHAERASGRRVQGFDSWEWGRWRRVFFVFFSFTDCAQRSAAQCALHTGPLHFNMIRIILHEAQRLAARLNFQVAWLWINEVYLFSWINSRCKLSPCKRK